MSTTPAPRLRFRDSRPARVDECRICGARHNSPVGVKHDPAVHEVWALETYGIHAVCFPARPYVEAWAAGTAPLPPAGAFHALR